MGGRRADAADGGEAGAEAVAPPSGFAAREGLHAAIGFPIRNTEFLGVMEFFSLEIRQPDKELLQMMTSITAAMSVLMIGTLSSVGSPTI